MRAFFINMLLTVKCIMRVWNDASINMQEQDS